MASLSFSTWDPGASSPLAAASEEKRVLLEQQIQRKSLEGRFGFVLRLIGDENLYHLFIDRGAIDLVKKYPALIPFIDGKPSISHLFDYTSDVSQGQEPEAGERGYYCGMKNAMSFLQKSEETEALIQLLSREGAREEQLNGFLRWYVALHDSAVKGVRNGDGDLFSLGIQPPEFPYYSIVRYLHQMNEQVWRELEEERLLIAADRITGVFCTPGYLAREDDQRIRTLLKEKVPDYKKYAALCIAGGVFINYKRVEESERCVRDAFAVYLDGLAAAKKERGAVIRSIARLCRKLEINHVFEDGNQRVITFGVLNWFLVQNGLCPTIVQDPNLFDGYLALDGLVEAIEEGQQHFMKLIR